MRTTRPISTISYNSPEFLATKLDELVSAKKLSFWAFIPHEPEDDEAGNKPHIHLYVVPSKMLLTDDLKDDLKEVDFTNLAKPRGCIPFRFSKFADWYLYGIHDRAYLASKGQSRKYHYHYDDVRASDDDALRFEVKTIDLLEVSPYQSMIEAQSQGITFNEYFARGTVPLPQCALFEKAWYLLLNQSTERNGGTTHTPAEAPKTPLEPPKRSSRYDKYTQPTIGVVNPNTGEWQEVEEIPNDDTLPFGSEV